MNKAWSELHNNYKKRDWINKPSIFAEQAIKYFPSSGKVLELGAGLGQDSCYFAEKGFTVTATDLETSAFEHAKANKNSLQIIFQQVDLRNELPFEGETFDVVYAHLSLHYFNYETTKRLIHEIERVLKLGGVLAFLVNSINDPQYKTGKEMEADYFQIEDKPKRFFSERTARELTQYLQVNLLDELGETYKDTAKGVHNLVRFVGKKPLTPAPFKSAISYVGAIVERNKNGVKEVLLQTRWMPHYDKLYSGCLEFPAGKLDVPYENIYDALAREIKEETGLILKCVKSDNKTKIYNAKKTDQSFGFRPFCCTQQLKDGKPWIGFVFICKVEDGEPVSQLSEAKDVQWLLVSEVKEIFLKNPKKLFGLELPAWEYYFEELESL